MMGLGDTKGDLAEMYAKWLMTYILSFINAKRIIAKTFLLYVIKEAEEAHV